MALIGNIGEFVEAQESWQQYIEKMEQFFATNDIPNAKTAPVLLASMGPVAFRVAGNLVAPEKPSSKTYADLVTVMSGYYNPKPIVTVQHYQFFSRFRQPDESISAFVAELRSLAKDCEFGAALENNLRDRLVCGVAEPSIQKRLLAEHNLTFKRAFELAQSHEAASKNAMKLGQPSSSADVHQIKTATHTSSDCYRCGRKGHLPQDCKFKTASCHYCGKEGHIKPVCRSYKRSSSTRSSESSYRSSESSSFRRRSRPKRNRSSGQSSDIKQIVQKPISSSDEYALFSVPSDTRAPVRVSVSFGGKPLWL